jgi:zinc protease
MAANEVEARLNRGVRRAGARIAKVKDIPFGERMRVERWRLGNGLTVLLLVDRAAPVVCYQSWFKVGSRYEEKGKTGLAHFFEHMMFNESANLPAGEFDRRMEEAGGETNAATWIDWTYYYEALPADELPLAIELESERMAHLVVRSTQVESEREVVANERRMSVEDDVFGKANETLYSLAFGREHPYGWPTIGWMEDIQGYKVRDCADFYKTWYAPNNATVIIAGDLDVEETLARVQKAYGSIPPSKLRKVAPPRAVKAKGERSVDLPWPTPTEKVLIGWQSPSYASRDHATAMVIDDLLTGGRSSRLRRKLVEELELVAEVNTSIAGLQHGGMFELWLSMREGVPVAKAMAEVEKELQRLRQEPVGQAELDKVINRSELQFVSHIETAAGKAYQMGFGETVVGNPAHAFERIREMREVSASDVQRVARSMFGKDRVRVSVRPRAEAA